MKVAVIGGGVIGLSTSLTLLKKGYNVILFESPDYQLSASHAACAIWLPFCVSDKDSVSNRKEAWLKASWDAFSSMIQYKNGIRVIEQHEFHNENSHHRFEENPDYKEIVDNFKTEANLNDGIDGCHKKQVFNTYMIEMPIYMKWLKSKYREHGGKIEQKHINQFSDVDCSNIVFNCSGLGAKQLTSDKELTPWKGQILRYPRNKDIKQSLGYDDFCVVRRSNDVIVGSSCIKDCESQGEDKQQTQLLKQRLLEWSKTPYGKRNHFENLVNQEPIGIVNGFRPFRASGIRLESEKIGEKTVYHNYGHGGSGVTYSWGTAEAIVRLFQSEMQ